MDDPGHHAGEDSNIIANKALATTIGWPHDEWPIVVQTGVAEGAHRRDSLLKP